MLARSGHEVAPPARSRATVSLPATRSSRRQRRSDLQEDGNSSGDDSKSGTGTGSEDQDTNSSEDGTGTNSDNTGVSGNTGDSGSGEAMSIDNKGDNSSDNDDDSSSDNNDSQTDSPSPVPRLALRKIVGSTSNDNPTILVATAAVATEKTRPIYDTPSITTGGGISTGDGPSPGDSLSADHRISAGDGLSADNHISAGSGTSNNASISVATVIAPVAMAGNVQIFSPVVGMATSSSHPGGPPFALKVCDSVSAALDQSDAVPTTPPGPGAVPDQGTLFYLALCM